MNLKIIPCGALAGEISVSGSKNAILPMLAASLLTDRVSVIENAPDISDVRSMCGILTGCGCAVDRRGDAVTVDSSDATPDCAGSGYAGRIRGSFLVAGACLARFGRARLPLPGGCPIGMRPIDLHLKGFVMLGADIRIENGIVTIHADRLRGTNIYLDFPSVGATENIMLAACGAEGETVISNASAEPEICALADMLREMGADVSGAGTDKVSVRGGKALGGVRVRVMPDRIEAGTYLALIAATRGKGTLHNVKSSHMIPVTAKLREMGAVIAETGGSIFIDASGGLNSADIKTMPYPGFPTDMQAQFCSVLCTCRGSGMVIETVFENRFLHISELVRMGASIKTEGRTAIVKGGADLTGAGVECRDLRGGAALVIAACAARGCTVIHDADHILRGYDSLTNKLCGLGCRAELI